MNRLTLAERIVIECGIYQKLKLNEIAKKIRKTTGSVSREIRANRTVAPGEHSFGKDCCFAGECKTKGLCGKTGCSKRCVACREYDCRELCSRYNNTPCLILSKPPYVCNTCVRRRKCKTDRAYYIAQQADAMAKRRYSNSRSKIQTRGTELEKLDELVSPLILKGQPLTHIWSEHGEELSISQRTLYRYIDQGVLSVGNIDLRRKVAYKPRRKKKEVSEGFFNQEFRKNRGYDDYLKYMEKHPDTPVIQMDTVKGCREQGKRLLTIHFCNTNMMLMLLMRDGNCAFHIQFFGVDALFLEVHADSDVLEHSYHDKEFFGLPCHSGNRLDDDAVNLAFLAVRYQPFEFITLFHFSSGDALIGINVDELIFGMLFCVVTVVPYLCCKGMELIGRVA